MVLALVMLGISTWAGASALPASTDTQRQVLSSDYNQASTSARTATPTATGTAPHGPPPVFSPTRTATRTRTPPPIATRKPPPDYSRTPTSIPTATRTGTPVPTVLVPGLNKRLFPETGKTVAGLFLDYWDQNGDLAQQGYPISEVLGEISPLNKKPYTMQYFERAVFEYHPENNSPYNVLLSQLGTFRYKQKYPNGAPNQKPNSSPETVLFPKTGKHLGGKFLGYWQKNGDVAQQGYPISEEFPEKSDLNGKIYTVQYFERAVFEMHPENAGTKYEVLLSQLGTFRYRDKYGGDKFSSLCIKSSLPSP
ncbi:MAG TPA: hypothetical protein VJ183_13575 [Chloroflexia bacterium]|nr:hypothetical protein [Chloroflexia bacterium]